MIIPKHDFKNAIDAVSPFARAKSTLQILTHVKIVSTGKRIMFTASHLDSQIDHWIDCDGEKFECCIEAAALKKFAQFCDSDVSLTLKGKKAVLEFGDTKTRLSTLDADMFPVLKLAERVVTEIDWAPLGAKIHFATQFCGVNASVPQCACVMVKSTGTQIAVYATDKISMSYEVLPHIAPEFGICIPVDTARHMVGPFKTLVVREDQLELRGPNSIALFKVAPHKVLNLANVINAKLPSVGTVNRKSLLDAISFVSSFSDSGKIRGMVTIESGETQQVRLVDPSHSNEASAPFECEGEGFSFNAYHADFASFLKALESDKPRIEFNKDDMVNTQIRLVEADRMIVTMPVRA